jgi:hypothetical protein
MKTYELIIEQAKNQIRERNHHFNVDEAFGKCEVEAISVLSELFGTFSYWSKVYCEEDNELNALKEYKVHETIINFYKSYEPKELDYLGDGVRLADLRGIKEENSSLSPGAFIIKYGLLVFATTMGGNAICMDLNSINNGEPRIIYADQTWFSFNDSERKLEIRFNHEDIPDNIVWFDKEVIRFLPEISKTFNDFLDKLSMNPDWDLEEYYNLIGNNL